MIICIIVLLLVARTKAVSIVGNHLTAVQVAAILEVVHPMLGWVKSGVSMAVIQVCIYTQARLVTPKLKS